jgi:hypothetical protein
LRGELNLTFKKPYVIVNHNTAQRLHHSKIPISDGSIIEIVIWQLPNATEERPHGLKYRLNYSLPDGTTLIRYDNELFKGDHRHIRTFEVAYTFKTIEQLLNDFFNDVINNGGLLE